MLIQHEKSKAVLAEAKAEFERQKEKNRSSNLKNMREMVINEIFSTEKNYVADLENGIFVREALK